MECLRELRQNTVLLFSNQELLEPLILTLPSESINLKEYNSKKESSERTKGLVNSMNSVIAKPERNGFKFFFDRLARLTIVILIVSVIFYFVRYLHHASIAQRVDNAVQLMVRSADTVNHFFNIKGAAVQIVLWNNTAKVWGRDALATFREILIPSLENEILPLFSKSLDFELGRFSDQYNRYMIKENPCGTVIFANKPNLCSKLYGGILNQGFFKIFKELKLLCENAVSTWEVSERSWSESEELMRSQYFLSTVTSLPDIMLPFYEWIYSGTMLILENIHNKPIYDNLLYSFMSEVILDTLIFTSLVLILLKGIKKIFKNSKLILNVLQIDVLSENKTLILRSFR